MMRYFGWNKVSPGRFEVFEVTKANHKAPSIIGAAVATFTMQQDCEKDCAKRNIAIVKGAA